MGFNLKSKPGKSNLIIGWEYVWYLVFIIFGIGAIVGALIQGIQR